MLTMFHCAYVALLAAKQCSAELRLEVSEPHLNLPQRTKRWEFPEPDDDDDDDDYTEASWPPALPVSDETWKDFICKGENMIAAMQARMQMRDDCSSQRGTLRRANGQAVVRMFT